MRIFRKTLSAVLAAGLALSAAPFSVSAAGEVAINEKNFPDEIFRNYVSEKIDKDGNGALSEKETSAVKRIDVYKRSIQDLTGIEYFTALEWLNCCSNELTSLDVSNNTALEELVCGGDQLTSLDVSRCTALTRLGCSGNQLTSLDVSKNTLLTYLDCNYNELTSLDVSKNTELTNLKCDGNQLTSLDVRGNTALTGLWCNNNKLTSLDVRGNTALTELYCQNNTYYIGKPAETFDLSKLPEGFDPENASDWEGAEYDPETNSLINITSNVITYNYDCGYGDPVGFTLCFDDSDYNYPGDINADGNIDSDDVDALLEILFGEKKPNENCDLNGDGIINIYDLIILKRMIMK